MMAIAIAKAKVKGIQLTAVLRFLGNRFGVDRVNALIEALDPADRILLPTVILDSSWYSVDIWRPVRRISRQLSTEKNVNLAIDMGRFIAEYAFAGVYKSLLEKEPTKQVEKFSWVHDFFYKDAQKLETRIVTPTSCIVRYRYEEGVHPARSSCAVTQGFWMKTVELSGGTSVRAHHEKCVIDGADCCEYFIEWQ